MPRYRADPPEMRLAVEAEGMTLLFHRPSGATHVLLPPAPEILAVLAGGAAEPTEVAARLIGRFGATEEGEPIEAVVMARLDELEAAGLVARA